MWEGKFTEELDKLYDEYKDIFGMYPDYYEGVIYHMMTYEYFVEAIKKSIATGKDIVDVID